MKLETITSFGKPSGTNRATGELNVETYCGGRSSALAIVRRRCCINFISGKGDAMAQRQKDATTANRQAKTFFFMKEQAFRVPKHVILRAGKKGRRRKEEKKRKKRKEEKKGGGK